MAYGERISILRSKMKMTQEELAKRIGITRAALSHYEKDRREPDYETLEKFADFFDVKIDYLLGRTDDPTPLGNKNPYDVTPETKTYIVAEGKYNFQDDPQVTGELRELLDTLVTLPTDEQKRIIEQALVYAAGLKAKNRSSEK
ncbi:helix-turn-helix domain-containing protein [Brevibacillus sp. MER 51]|uniref:helix-turn-helix domain-containing protein n=1 Tax=Brevibacillus sp. MER 51 TaxID=2939560 RepID=UPI00203E4B6C|nr:helix-turn-helix domain-containing protein [Brevibacillus sp. MER 51]MCM3144317.1 helix-turn-helix domain-containing protein [Brevibacillus sp. MER 51]